jgi:hypothetical protein
LVLSVGALKTWEKWNLGVRLTAPSIDVLESGSVYELNYQSVGLEPPELNEIRESDLNGQFKSPFEMGIGAVYHPNETWSFVGDLTFRTGLDYILFEDFENSDQRLTKGNYRLNGEADVPSSRPVRLPFGRDLHALNA